MNDSNWNPMSVLSTTIWDATKFQKTIIQLSKKSFVKIDLKCIYIFKSGHVDTYPYQVQKAQPRCAVECTAASDTHE